MSEPPAGSGRRAIPLIVRVIALALALNVAAWLLAGWRPDDHGN